MRAAAIRIGLLIALACAVWGVRVLGGPPNGPSIAEAAAGALAAGPSAADEATAVRETVRFLEAKVRSDPDDARANNKLAGYHLQLLRETGSIDDLEAAVQAAHASLASVPVVRNGDGVTALALAQFASHDFGGARDRARDLIRFDPSKSYPYAILGDALVELGAYGEAELAYRDMTRLSGGVDTNGEPRLARLAFLHGDVVGAARHFTNALSLAVQLPVPPRETIAWCQWQLGETAFAQGRYETAERYDRDALASLPGYFRALGSLGRVRAARGDVGDALEQYGAAIRRFPDPTYVAAVGDLDRLIGRNGDAAAQYALVEAIGNLSAVNGVLYNRQLALFYADHDIKPREAYASAKREYVARRDVYGADAVAWTALKAGKLAEARAAMRAALRLGTQDARLLYHAGMIARADGHELAAQAYLRRALALSPQFDPLQAQVARAALEAPTRS